jgi:hypothetical protein
MDASFPLPWHRGLEFLINEPNFQKPRDCQSIAGFLFGAMGINQF